MLLWFFLILCIAETSSSVIGNNPTWEDRVYNLMDGNRVWVVQNIDERQQVANFRVAGYDVNMLDGNTQLKVFFYTWLSMERAEGGRCCNGLKTGGCEVIFNRGCCRGWTLKYGICTKFSWYKGPEEKSIRKTLDELLNISKV